MDPGKHEYDFEIDPKAVGCCDSILEQGGPENRGRIEWLPADAVNNEKPYCDSCGPEDAGDEAFSEKL